MNVAITGATDGIGLALARTYQQAGARLILIGRRAIETLDANLFTPDCYCHADLTKTKSIEQISLWLHENNIVVLDLVIHNAGLGYVGALAAQSDENIRHLIDVNLRAPIALTHALYPWVERAAGKFVFISSVVAGLAGPNYAVYTATKAALDSFVRNWQIELRAAKSPVQAQLIRPGATRTQMHEKSGADLKALHWDRFPAPETVAEQIIQATTRNHRATTLGLVNQLRYTSGRTFPTLLDRTVARKHPITQSPNHPTTTPGSPATRSCASPSAATGNRRPTGPQA